MYNTHVFLKNDMLEFRDISPVIPALRLLKDMKALFMDPSMDDDDEMLYAMYRNVVLPEHKGLFERMHLRHDITVIPVKFIGMEYVKTFGHYHPNGFPEIYEVLEGECCFLLQKRGPDGSIKDFIVIRAKKGNVIVIPPGYGHVTVNHYGKTLVMANIVSDKFDSDYLPYIELKGAAYYHTTGGFIRNPAYKSVPEIRFLQPNGSVFGNIYESFVKNPEKFAFLSEPEKALEEFMNL
ncbi:MAG: glucose-6-phosphate isomerase family protein [Candidatus Aenigmarchaeota archaeon]|nr:glucose-6-phosphate isomerase family protein [Candidatus Aenigmarchaeota archaeon]MDI6722534.1 glucose-6-phosphate isomerase family protein [Candidatus Aenigmarchaeota archaeon]